MKVLSEVKSPSKKIPTIDMWSEDGPVLTMGILGISA